MARQDKERCSIPWFNGIRNAYRRNLLLPSNLGAANTASRAPSAYDAAANIGIACGGTRTGYFSSCNRPRVLLSDLFSLPAAPFTAWSKVAATCVTAVG